MNRKIYAILLAFVMLLSLSTTVFAVESDADSTPALYIQAQQEEGEMVVSVYLQGCGGVTNGRFIVSYDPEAVAHATVATSDAYELSSINDQTAGTVALAWVGSQLTEEPVLMLTIRLRPVGEVFVETTYTVESDGIFADGEQLAVAGASVTTEPDASALEQAIKKAEGLEKMMYTEQSFAAVEAALQKAKAVLADPEATQAEMDAAAKALNEAMAALEQADENPPTFDSKAIVWTAFLAAASAVGFIALLTRDKRRYYG